MFDVFTGIMTYDSHQLFHLDVASGDFKLEPSEGLGLGVCSKPGDLEVHFANRKRVRKGQRLSASRVCRRRGYFTSTYSLSLAAWAFKV